MNLPRSFTGLFLATAAFVGAAQADDGAQEGKGTAFRVLIGGHLVSQSNGIGASWTPDVSGDDGGVVAALSFNGKEQTRYPYGVSLELEGNGVEVGPPVGPAGRQFFGIATLRLSGLVEIRFRDPRTSDPTKLQPYATLGAGWNRHSSGSQISWPGPPPPSGTPLSLSLEGSPAVRLGLGFNHKTRGVSFNLEGGWAWDAGHYRVRVQDEADRSGRYDLSGAFLLLGARLRG